MDPALLALYGILATQGVAWVLGHCPGMCGPLVLGLGFPSVLRLLAYQAGKAVTYALLGAVAGALGGVALLALRQWAPVLLITLALGMGTAGVLGLRRRGLDQTPVPGFLQAALRRWAAGRNGPFLLGLILAFLPCGVVVWALGLAIAAADPWHGALLMLGLIVLNTPVLVAVQLAGQAAGLARIRTRLWWLPPATLIASGAWLLGLALTAGGPRCL
jgi:uncharacterized protein